MSVKVTIWIDPKARRGEKWVVTHLHGSLVDHYRFDTKAKATVKARELRHP